MVSTSRVVMWVARRASRVMSCSRSSGVLTIRVSDVRHFQMQVRAGISLGYFRSGQGGDQEPVMPFEARVSAMSETTR